MVTFSMMHSTFNKHLLSAWYHPGAVGKNDPAVRGNCLMSQHIKSLNQVSLHTEEDKVIN